MAAVRFPESVGIGNNGGRTEARRHELKWALKTEARTRGADIIEISTEAKKRFEKDNLIRLEKVKLMKEARRYKDLLEDDNKFSRADLRGIYRTDDIRRAKNRLDEGFYDRFENQLIEKVLKKTGF